jgi:hypothetical protein
MTARKVVSILGAEPTLKPLLARARELEYLQQIVIDCVPAALALASRVAALNEGTLIIVTDNGAVAAKLKQLTTRLQHQFLLRNREVTQIRVTVQVADAGSAQKAPGPRPIPPEGIRHLCGLAQSLPPGTVKTALTGVLRRQASRAKTPRSDQDEPLDDRKSKHDNAGD